MRGNEPYGVTWAKEILAMYAHQAREDFRFFFHPSFLPRNDKKKAEVKNWYAFVCVCVCVCASACMCNLVSDKG